MKYVKRPIPIDAWKYTYENFQKGLPDFIRIEQCKPDCRLYLIVDDINKTVSGTCKTLEGQVRLDEGCYIIKGIHGEFYPCDSKIFEESYVEVR